jgi:8-oxo-dGTP pyrophosphatase MutT (NUDIX family)
VSDEPDRTWEIVESEYVIDTKYLRLRKDSIVLPGGERIDDYYVRESPGFSIIFATTPDNLVLLVRQYKHGIRKAMLELPAGAIDPGESAMACARRELEEETGYVGGSGELEHTGTFITDPTNSNSRFFLFHARDAVPRGRQQLEPTEQITVETATMDELRGYLRDGTIECSPHVTSIYHMLDRLGRL